MSENGVVDAEQTVVPCRNGSRFNAVKHGLFARSAVLPGEDLDEFRARVEIYREGLNPRNELQDDLARKAALSSWQHDRAVAAERSRAESELDELEKAAARERLEALELGNRLLFDRRGANEMYASREFHAKQPKTSFSDDPCDPDQPERLVLQLEQTAAGCGLLLQHWGELRGILERGQGWQSREKLVVSRLLGMQPIHVVHKPELAKIFLACHVIEPQFQGAFRELRCELDENSYNRYRACLSRRDVDELTPADAAAARAFLLKVVDDASARLRALEAGLQKKWDENQARARTLIALGISKTGEQIRRAQGSFNRLLLRNVDAVRRVQREDDRGWDVVRQAREERKALRNKNKREMRKVMDAHGIVGDAEGYEGDLEAGMERFERNFGPQTNGDAVERNMRQAVPDYARWRAPADQPEQTRGGSDGRGLGVWEPELASGDPYDAVIAEMERQAEARLERELAAEQAEAEQAEAKLRNEAVTSDLVPAVDVTLIVMETGAQENIRNEIGGEEIASGMGEDDEAGAAENHEFLPKEGKRKCKKRMSGPPDMVDESLEGIEWLLPNTVRFLEGQRELL
jgi:hypothetical protein